MSLSHRCPRVSVCCLGCCSSMTQTSWLMHAGHSPTYLMAPMTKSRLLLTQESVAGWWSCWCKALNTYCIVYTMSYVFTQTVTECTMCSIHHHCIGCDNPDVGVLGTFPDSIWLIHYQLWQMHKLGEDTLHFKSPNSLSMWTNTINSQTFEGMSVSSFGISMWSYISILLCPRHSDYKVVSPALRAVGNIVTGDDLQTQVMATCTHTHKVILLLQKLTEYF